MFSYKLSQIVTKVLLCGSLLCLTATLIAGCTGEIRNPITIHDKAAQ